MGVRHSIYASVGLPRSIDASMGVPHDFCASTGVPLSFCASMGDPHSLLSSMGVSIQRFTERRSDTTKSKISKVEGFFVNNHANTNKLPQNVRISMQDCCSRFVDLVEKLKFAKYRLSERQISAVFKPKYTGVGVRISQLVSLIWLNAYSGDVTSDRPICFCFPDRATARNKLHKITNIRVLGGFA